MCVVDVCPSNYGDVFYPNIPTAGRPDSGVSNGTRTACEHPQVLLCKPKLTVTFTSIQAMGLIPL